MSQPLLLLTSLKHAREAKKVPLAGIPDLGHRVPSLSRQTRFFKVLSRNATAEPTEI
jgi:hypothetical protein